MAKSIVILLDGTSNEISSDRSNILRLYGVLKKSAQQLVYYDPGVGTFGAEGAWSRFWRKAHEVWGLATGWGLDHNVKEAYRFLVEHYDSGKISGAGLPRETGSTSWASAAAPTQPAFLPASSTLWG
jgi:uncharacterized protein (DUF2235 family)